MVYGPIRAYHPLAFLCAWERLIPRRADSATPMPAVSVDYDGAAAFIEICDFAKKYHVDLLLAVVKAPLKAA